MSILVPMKHLKESSIEQTIGSPLTLNDVFTKIGQPVTSLKVYDIWDLSLYVRFVF